MQTQADFDFDPATHARAADLSTSHVAAESMRDSAPILCSLIYSSLVDGPGTFEEIAQRLKLEPAKVWKRISDLKNKRMIEPTGETRPGKSGRRQTVWGIRW